jgi:thioredoxin 1
MNCPTCKNPNMNPAATCEWCGSALNNLISAECEILFFTAKWRGPCKVMLPIVRNSILKFPTLNLKIVDVDIQKNEAIKFQVTNIPALVKVKNGNHISTLVGANSKSEIEKFMSN